MATGLTSPLRVNIKGGAMTVSGSELVRQLLIAALRDCSSANPFQALGISDKTIFDISDQQSIGNLRLKVQQIFVQFEAQQLARLIRGEEGLVFWKSEEGQLNVDVKYIDLETDKAETINAQYNSDQGWK